MATGWCDGAGVQLFTSLVTPFDDAGEVDYRRLRAHVLWQMTQGIDGFVVTLGAGEFLVLDAEERARIHHTVLDAVPNRPVYLGVWAPREQERRDLMLQGRDRGAFAAILAPPLLVGAPNDAIERMYRSVKGAALPLWGVHSRTFGTNIEASTFADLRRDGVLQGIVDDSGDRFRLSRLARTAPERVLAGSDPDLPELLNLNGVQAFVSILTNLWPAFGLQLFRDRDATIGQAWIERADRIRTAGGLGAVKTLLRMGCRGPVHEVPEERLEGLPAAEQL
ncbi:MAG: dihydrodipicolinate synthase family protein [Myxococcota bacterium]